MESDRDPRQLLAEAERAGAAPYIDYPPTPWWYAPIVGAWAAAMVLTIGAMSDHKLVAVPVLIVLIALEGAFFAWYRHYRKTNPTLTNAPPEIAGAMRRYAVGVVVVIGVCVLAFVVGGPVVSAVVAFVTVTAGLVLYERQYAAAAAVLRDRLLVSDIGLADLDPVIHAPKRLAAMAILANSTSTDFAFLREYLGISDSDLSKQMAALEKAGYVSITKTSRGRGGATTYRITKDGAAAFQRHLAALRAITGPR